MSALARLKARLQSSGTPQERTAKTDKTGSVSFVSADWGASRNLEPGARAPAAVANDLHDVLEPVGVVIDDEGFPAWTCTTCDSRQFHQAPGDRWRCSSCEPAALPQDLTGWAFCTLPDPEAEPAPLVPPSAAPVQAINNGMTAVLPEPATAPIGKCRTCGWMGPLDPHGVCAPCLLREGGTQP